MSVSDGVGLHKDDGRHGKRNNMEVGKGGSAKDKRRRETHRISGSKQAIDERASGGVGDGCAKLTVYQCTVVLRSIRKAIFGFFDVTTGTFRNRARLGNLIRRQRSATLG
jgi:hypothetical protein